jgi:hypothetical protein
MIPYDDSLPEWKPIRYERRWHIWRKVGDQVERSVESFGNRATALVVAETLNGEQRAVFDKMLRDMLKGDQE